MSLSYRFFLGSRLAEFYVAAHEVLKPRLASLIEQKASSQSIEREVEARALRLLEQYSQQASLSL